ncbi:glycosyltransferase [Shimia sp. R10_1]|uniref:glycosyltransferase family 2 protein n=1 Tax=Shimia sp. R10_1 TaxID=2821095 RepID=UPI001AD9FFC8|nr:glycosyltransferase [Shimia sp. R10_1]
MRDLDNRIAVVICSVGRPDELADLVPHLTKQTRMPDRVVFVVTKPEDAPQDLTAPFSEGTEAVVLYSDKGLTKQRNMGLDAVQNDCDLVVFFDDDFVPSRYALEGIEGAFAAWPDVNGMTGHLIADGINGGGYEAAQAADMVAQYDTTPRSEPTVLRSGLVGLYGCNMAYRLSAVGETRFDPALPLYGWQEDIDFAAQIPGERIKTDAFSGVHCGTKNGRETAGARLGYSQLVNTWYLWRKGTMSGRFAFKLAARNMIANHVKLLRPEPWIDRKARAIGNWRAVKDILTGIAHPERILEF